MHLRAYSLGMRLKPLKNDYSELDVEITQPTTLYFQVVPHYTRIFSLPVTVIASDEATFNKCRQTSSEYYDMPNI